MTAEDRIPRFPLLGILTMVLIFVLLRTPGSPPKFRPQYDASIYPEEALAAVRKMGPSTRMVTTDIWGGYLIYRLYPDFRVFWDGRADFYGTPYNLAALDALMGRPGWDKTLAENRITAVLVPVNQPLVSLLAQSGDWHVVYKDEVAILFQLSPAGKTSSESESRAGRPLTLKSPRSFLKAFPGGGARLPAGRRNADLDVALLIPQKLV